jgi:hypothetical protein
VYFTRHDRFLESLRPIRQFQELMAGARERYERFTDDGTPTRVIEREDPTGVSGR